MSEGVICGYCGGPHALVDCEQAKDASEYSAGERLVDGWRDEVENPTGPATEHPGGVQTFESPQKPTRAEPGADSPFPKPPLGYCSQHGTTMIPAMVICGGCGLPLCAGCWAKPEHPDICDPTASDRSRLDAIHVIASAWMDCSCLGGCPDCVDRITHIHALSDPKLSNKED
jgi:hypothetical protein